MDIKRIEKFEKNISESVVKGTRKQSCGIITDAVGQEIQLHIVATVIKG